MKKLLFLVIGIVLSFTMMMSALTGCSDSTGTTDNSGDTSSVSISNRSDSGSQADSGSQSDSGQADTSLSSGDGGNNSSGDDGGEGTPIEVDSEMKAYAKNVVKKSDRDFKVLYLTDIQLHDGEDPTITLGVIDQLVEKEEPDLIIHMGDLINDSKY